MFLISCKQCPGCEVNPLGMCMKTLSGLLAGINTFVKSTEQEYHPKNNDMIRNLLTVLKAMTGDATSWMSFIRSPLSMIHPLYFVIVSSGLRFSLKTHWDGIIL